MSASKEFLTTEEVASLYRMTTRGVVIWIREGRLKAYRAGHRYLIRPEDAEALLQPGGKNDAK